ncbi:sensor domain-containing protein [Amycolatopsis sp. NPDC003676]
MTPTADRLRTHRNPFRTLFSASPWTATAYLLSYLPVGTFLFCAATVVVVVAYAANITWLGLPLLVGAAGIVRGCAEIERARTALVASRIDGHYRIVHGSGVFTQMKTRWTDPATLRDCVYLILLYPVLLLLDSATLLIWLTTIGLITVPLWYWAVPQHLGSGDTAHGLIGNGSNGVWIGDLASALLVAAGAFLLSTATVYLVIGTAKLHLKIARTMLGKPADPLAAARRMLAEPGPLPAMTDK